MRKKGKAKKNSIQSKIREISLQLRKKRKGIAYINKPPSVTNVYRLKRSEKLNALPSIYSEAKKIFNFFEQLFPSILPTSFNEIKKVSCKDWSTDDGFKDLLWTLLLISDHVYEINKFILLEQQYEKAYLLGKYADCLSILDSIDNSICVSMWSMCERISLKHKMSGLKGHKTLVAEMMNFANREVPFIIHQISNKVEDKVSSQWFKRNVNNMLQKNDLNSELLNYLQYKILGVNSINTANVLPIMMSEINSSIIDIYLTFIRCCQKYFAEYENQKNVPSVIKHHMGKLSENLDDFRVKKITLAIGVLIDINKDTAVLELLDYYTQGNYEKCHTLTESYLIEYPNDISIAELYSKCCIRTNRRSTFKDNDLAKIIDSFALILKKDTELYSKYNFLMKETLLNIGFNFSYEIESFITRELSEIRIDNNGVVNIGYLNSRTFTPLLCNTFQSKQAVHHIIDNIKKFYRGITVELYNSYRYSDESFEKEILLLNIPPSRKHKLIANKYFFRGNYDLAISHYEKLQLCGDQLSSNETLGHYSISCMENGDLSQGCQLISEAYVNNTQLHLNLPYKYAAEKLGFGNWPKTIDVPILFFIYSAHSAKDKLEHLRFSFEYFLKAKNRKIPSELYEFRNEIGIEKLSFFYEFICVYEVMKRYLPLKGTTAIDKERLSLLNLLRKMNINDDERYLEEIKSITQKLVVKEGVKSIGRSKIYVDTENVKSKLAGEIGESFERYRDLLTNNVYDIEINYSSELIGSLNGKHDIPLLTLIKRQQQDDNLIARALRRIFWEFLNGEFGLNNFLSSRIRHGTLLNTLSNPLLNEKLLTPYDEDKNEFQPNEFWLDKFDVPFKESNNISLLFSRFSENFYTLIKKIRDRKIQIFYEEHPTTVEKVTHEELFYFDLYHADLNFVKRKITEKMEYKDFMNIVFARLWQHVEEKLENVKSYLASEVSVNFKTLFEEFSTELGKLPSSAAQQELKNSLNRARVNFNSTIGEVTSWFNRSEAAVLNDFNINIALKIADKMLSGFDGITQFDLVEKIDDSVSFRGSHLVYFVDILYPLLDNVIQRSKLKTEDRRVSISSGYSKGILNFKIINNTTKIDCIESINEELAVKIKNHLRDFEPHMLAKEGGTGFYKIIKAIKNGLGSEIRCFQAYYSDAEEFTVNISFNIERLLV
jgi:hypothetical protein